MRISNEIEADFDTLIKADIGAQTSYKSSFLDWLHFRARAVPERTRTIIRSKQILGRRDVAVRTILHNLGHANSVRPWLSHSIRDQAANAKVDTMFNQWQISHFHLGPTKPNSRGAERTGDLMFVFIDRDRAVALDVQPHNSWTKQDLLRILLDTSPTDMEKFELNAELGMAFNGTDEDLKALRKKGINSPVAIDGRVFVPGLGMTLSKHATRLVLFQDKIVSQIARAVVDLESDNCEPDTLAALRQVNGKPRIGVSITAGEIFLYEKQNNLQIVRFPALA